MKTYKIADYLKSQGYTETNIENDIWSEKTFYRHLNTFHVNATNGVSFIAKGPVKFEYIIIYDGGNRVEWCTEKEWIRELFKMTTEEIRQ